MQLQLFPRRGSELSNVCGLCVFEEDSATNPET